MKDIHYSFYLAKAPHPTKITTSELILHYYSLEKKRQCNVHLGFYSRTKSFSVVVMSRALCIILSYKEERPGVRKD